LYLSNHSKCTFTFAANAAPLKRNIFNLVRRHSAPPIFLAFRKALANEEAPHRPPKIRQVPAAKSLNLRELRARQSRSLVMMALQ
jgi:hypothetical protein